MAGGNVIGQIETDEFYVRYHTGYWYLDGSRGHIWTGVEQVHPIIFRDSSGSVRKGYINETHRYANDHSDEMLRNDTYIPNQEYYHYFSVEDNNLVENPENAAGFYEFTVKQYLKYYDDNKQYIGTLNPGEKIMTKGSLAGVSLSWCMYFDKYLPVGENAWLDLNPEGEKGSRGAFVDLGLQYGSKGNARAIW